MALSDKVYSALIGLYPSSYRQEYGPLMVQLFRDLRQDAYREERTFGMVKLWARVLADTGSSASSEQLAELRRTLAQRAVGCDRSSVTPGLIAALLVSSVLVALGILVKAVIVAKGGPIVLAALALLLANFAAGAIMDLATRARGVVIEAVTILSACSLLPLIWVTDKGGWLLGSPVNVGVMMILGAYGLRGKSGWPLIIAACILGGAIIAVSLF